MNTIDEGGVVFGFLNSIASVNILRHQVVNTLIYSFGLWKLGKSFQWCFPSVIWFSPRRRSYLLLLFLNLIQHFRMDRIFFLRHNNLLHFDHLILVQKFDKQFHISEDEPSRLQESTGDQSKATSNSTGKSISFVINAIREILFKFRSTIFVSRSSLWFCSTILNEKLKILNICWNASWYQKSQILLRKYCLLSINLYL